MRKFCLTLFLFIMIVPAYSQVGSIYSPFVSRIKIVADTSSVKITWKDTKDMSGKCIIYRHTSVINSKNFTESTKVGEVLQGLEFFEDYPPKAYTDYYYCVIILDGDDFLHDVFIPFRNNATKPVSIEKVQKRDSKYLDPAKIEAIKTSVFEDKIIISFNCNKPTSEIFIYRNTTPILNKEGLLSSIHIATTSGSNAIFSDYPIPGVDYYYAALDSIHIKSDNFSLKKGENTTSMAVQIPLVAATRVGLPKIDASRSNPIPLLSITKGSQTGKELSPSFIDTMPQYKQLSQETEKIILDVMDKIKPASTDYLRPVILKESRNPQEGSEEEILYKILKEDFEKCNYSKAKDRLVELQKIKHSKDVEASIHFYLGQIYYFFKQYDKAFTEFVFAEEYFYIETIPWKNDVYKQLRNK